MARTTVRKPAWSPQATWSAALRLGDLVIEGERWPVFEARGLTREGVTELRTDAETFKIALAAGTGLEAQLAATVALTTQCEQAGKVVIRSREGLRRSNVSEAAMTKAGVGQVVDPKRSGTVEKALANLIAAAGDPTFGPEIAAAGFIEANVTKANNYLTRIRVLDEVQELAKGARPRTTSRLRQLQLQIQDGVNNILGKANLALDEDDDSLMLFTNCLPRSAGGTGEEVEEEDTTPAAATSETPAVPDV